MADEYDDDEYEEQQPNSDIRKLRQKAKEYDALQSQLAAKDRELAFARARLDLDDPKMGYFVRGYDGELTTEAIRQKAAEDGFIPRDTNPDSQKELKTQQRIANASSGASETPPVDLQDLIRQASSPEEVMRLMDQAGFPTSMNHE